MTSKRTVRAWAAIDLDEELDIDTIRIEKESTEYLARYYGYERVVPVTITIEEPAK